MQEKGNKKHVTTQDRGCLLLSTPSQQYPTYLFITVFPGDILFGSTDLTVDVGPSVQQHLNHGLVSPHTGIHEWCHPLEGRDGEKRGDRFTVTCRGDSYRTIWSQFQGFSIPKVWTLYFFITRSETLSNLNNYCHI